MNKSETSFQLLKTQYRRYTVYPECSPLNSVSSTVFNAMLSIQFEAKNLLYVAYKL